jgi:hypothetical protein
VVPTATKRILRRRFPGTCETVGQVFKFVWRLCWKINVVCISLSPFDSFQSRFVTYLLNCPRIILPDNRKAVVHDTGDNYERGRLWRALGQLYSFYL